MVEMYFFEQNTENLNKAKNSNSSVFKVIYEGIGIMKIEWKVPYLPSAGNRRETKKDKSKENNMNKADYESICR